MIQKCNCRHEAQDKMYGPGMRVHNFARKGLGTRPGCRCTVCGKVKEAKGYTKQEEEQPSE